MFKPMPGEKKKRTSSIFRILSGSVVNFGRIPKSVNVDSKTITVTNLQINLITNNTALLIEFQKRIRHVLKFEAKID
jgi:hypothetical protein